jgi:hypothetical protein
MFRATNARSGEVALEDEAKPEGEHHRGAHVKREEDVSNISTVVLDGKPQPNVYYFKYLGATLPATVDVRRRLRSESRRPKVFSRNTRSLQICTPV